jgi:hypothetical protein
MNDLTYSCPIGRFWLEVERNDSGKNESRVVLRSNLEGGVKARFTVEELHDLHYVAGRAIAAVELEQRKP